MLVVGFSWVTSLSMIHNPCRTATTFVKKSSIPRHTPIKTVKDRRQKLSILRRYLSIDWSSGQCGKAPIEVANVADKGDRKVSANTYDLNGEVVKKEARIIDGEKASPLEYPFQVFITNNRTDQNQVNCGGSIIAREWVLTAAHCMVPFLG